MNILLISQHFAIRGGSDVIVQQTRRLLEAEGHRVHLFAARTGDMPDDGIYPDAAHFERPRPHTLWRFLYSPQARARLEAYLDRHPIDVAHLHIHYGTLTSAILKPLQRRGIPILQHLHEYRSFCAVYTATRNGAPCGDCRVGAYLPGITNRCNQGSLMRSAVTTAEMYVADRLGAKSAPARFLTVSQFQRRLIVGQGLPGARVQTLYNPVDPLFFTVDAATVPARQGIVFVGRLERYKGVFDLLEVAERLPGIPVTLIGTGSEEAALRKRIVDRGLGHVTLCGSLARTEVARQIARHRVMVVPSRWHETFGLTAVEGMAVGVPVVVTDMGGLPEVVEDGVSGLVVRAGDLDAMTACLAELATGSERAAVMGQAARHRARTVFSETRFVTDLTAHFAQLAA